MRSRQGLVTVLVAALGAVTLMPVEALAQAVDCGGSRIDYVQTGNGPDVTTICRGNFDAICQDPTLSAPTYTFEDGCNPYFGTCSGVAELQAEFPGNHNNGFDQFYSFAALELRGLDGSLIGDCGHPFATITQDFGTATVTGGANCLQQGLSTANLTAIACKDNGACEKTFMVQLDFDLNAGCVPPRMQQCGTGDASCRECTPGGTSPGGGGPGLGGPGSPQTGPKATLRYAAGGVGLEGLPGSPEWRVTLGRYWSHDYAQRIIPLPDESRVWLATELGTFREWSSPDATTGVYGTVAPSSEYRTLTFLGTGLGWELAELDGTVHAFGDDGRWLSTTDRNGSAKVATYDASDFLVSVDFPDSRREDFTYHPVGAPAEGKLETITEVGVDGSTSRTWAYTWVGDDLTRIDRPDGSALVFAYEDARHPGWITRIELEGTDGTSIRVLRGYEFDELGNVTKTWKGDIAPDGPDAVDVWTLSFDNPDEPTVTTVTPPVGSDIIYQLARDTVSSNVKVTSIAGDCPTCGLGPNSQLFYEDANHPLLPTRIVDGRGTETLLEYDGNGQRTSRTEAFGDPEERTTTWTYDATYPALVTSMEQPSTSGGMATRWTDWTRDAAGDATERTISGVEAGSAFTLTTSTTFNAEGQPLTIDPPGHGTDDVTTFSYDPGRGNLVADSRTDPLMGSTLFEYDAFNRRASVTDPNLVETTTAFDPLDRVTEVRQVGASPPADDLVTTHEYNAFGDLLQTTLPEGNVIEYGYDAAGRLTSIERKPDASTPGERTLFTLDAGGNRTLEELQRWDPAADGGAGAWVTVSSTAFEYTNRCRVDRIVQAPGLPEAAATSFEYDCNGNLSAQWDANHDPAVDPPTTSYTYDPLDRLLTISQPWNPPGGSAGTATTTYAYDVQDHLEAVTDAEGNTTTYTYSDRDLLTQEVSPVSGTTTNSYDEHGELVTTTDARGISVTRTLDALDRVTFVDYPDDALDTAYTYDAAPTVCGGTSFPVGRLASITRNSQPVNYCYDRFGRTTRDGELTYTWDDNGNRTTIGYPGGVTASYTHDFADREVSLEVTSPGGTETVVSAATYLPSGPLSSLALGSGVTETRAFDGRYVPAAITLEGPVERTFAYITDPVGNVLEIVEQAGCTPGPIVLEAQTVTTEETVVSCSTIQAGNGYAVESPGDVTFHADGTVALKNGFSVGDGARFTAGSGGPPELSRRTFSYQSPQYFLTEASGPWGDLSWSYDTIGNRLTETRDGATDAYTYLTNADGGNTPTLDFIDRGAFGTRDYTYGPAGHLEEVAAGANVIDFASDAEGRLASTNRAVADISAGFQYDGRSFLTQAVESTGDPPAEAASVESVYDSAGLLHLLRRQPSPSDPEELVVHVYLAGRPVAQLTIAGDGTESWAYLTTDHLGTPLLATDDTGALVWEGGLEPFGRDYQEGMGSSASNAGIFLRLPGQWDERSWADATSGASAYYNVHRWYQPSAGAYTRPDPADFDPAVAGVYRYVNSNPVVGTDPFGLFRVDAGAPACLVEYLKNSVPDLVSHPTIPGNLSAATGAAPQEIPIALSWGSGPKVVLTHIPESPGEARFGEFDPDHPDEIRIQRRLVDQLCDCPCDEAVVGLGIALLHELAHKLHRDYRGREAKGVEAGDDFTDRTYDPDTFNRSIGRFYFGCN